MNVTHKLSVVAELQTLDTIRDFVRGTAQALGVAPRIVPHLLLAMDEAATNVVEHGYLGRPGEVEIEIYLEAADVVMCLRDHAPAFDPTTQVPAPDLTSPIEDRDPGRLGVYFIREFMDEVIHHVAPGGGNVLIMRKHLT